MKKSSRTTEQPLYDMVRTGMLEKLRSGQWAPGVRIPTESQLAEQFSVSIGTVRKAVEDLVAERVWQEAVKNAPENDALQKTIKRFKP